MLDRLGLADYAPKMGGLSRSRGGGAVTEPLVVLRHILAQRMFSMMRCSLHATVGRRGDYNEAKVYGCGTIVCTGIPD